MELKPTYKHISEVIRKYLEQYKDIYGKELYLHKGNTRKNKSK